MQQKTAIIIGAGPAGLTAAYEFLTRTDIRPIVIEKSTYMGGISRTVQYKGNRMDLGGHRFFSKSKRVMDWWLHHLPVEAAGEQDSSRRDRVMLVRERKSRIYFLRKFFNYPIQLSRDTLSKLGFVRTIRMGFSYLNVRLFPLRKVENLEQFFISRFGRELYRTFFKSYTEKVWGTSCKNISAAWGEQRIKSLSVSKAIAHACRDMFGSKPKDIAQRQVETSLIERFLYPKFGPGQLWEEVASKVTAAGGVILTQTDVTAIRTDGDRVTVIETIDGNGSRKTIEGDYFISTMPMKELVCKLDSKIVAEVREVAEGLIYRDFLTVGLLVRKLSVADPGQREKLIKDNWIYLQDPDITAGRLQIFNNWSPHLVSDQDKVWLGVEYFCNEGEALWNQTDEALGELARQELHRVGILDRDDVLDFTVHRVQKAYPAYFGTYDRFEKLREFLDGFGNLFLIGRNGMHRYNNQDHSMLTAMTAVDNIIAGIWDKSNIWAVNTEMEYHEAKRVVGPKFPHSGPELAPCSTGSRQLDVVPG